MNTLGKYQLGEKIRENEYGIVYKAIDNETRDDVIVLVIHPQMINDIDSQESVRKSIRFVENLSSEIDLQPEEVDGRILIILNRRKKKFEPRWVFFSSGIILIFAFFLIGKNLIDNQFLSGVSELNATFVPSGFMTEMNAEGTHGPATITPTAFPTEIIAKGTNKISEIDGMTLFYIPAGKFIMGTDQGNKDEWPAHEVFLDAYWIDQTEITNEKYQNCVSAGYCTEPIEKRSFSFDQYYNNPIFKNFPVIFVTWQQANDYCIWAGRRLPTEAEWEKAARSSKNQIYPWGNMSPSENYTNLGGGTTEVGSFPDGKSPYGVLDMAGNVWEWVSDWYNEDYYRVSRSLNPQGPSQGNLRVLRGGSWNSDKEFLRSTYRGTSSPDNATSRTGFRCVMDAE